MTSGLVSLTLRGALAQSSLGAVLLFIAATPALAAEPCPVDPSTTRASSKAIDPPIVLTPEENSASRVVNFGAGRGAKSTVLHVKVDPALPLGGEQSLRLEADPLVRTGNSNAETIDFADIRFSALQVSANRERISFKACLTPSNALPAGNYTGVVTLDGPSGVEGATVTITANAKNGTLFWGGVLLTLVLAYLVVLYKAAADTRALRITGAQDGDDAAKEDAAKWWPAFWANVRDVGFEFRSVLTLGATFGALYALWEANPAWGEAGTIASLIALVGVGVAAVGARAIIDPSTTPSQTR